MTREQKEIQDREIRGITPKIIAWIIGSTITIMMSIGGGIWAFSAQMTRFNDRIKAVEDKASANTININSLFLKDNSQDVEIQALKDRKN